MCQSYVLDGPNLVKGVPVDALAPGPAEGRGRAAVVEADHDIPLLGEHQVPENKVRVDMGIFEAVARGFLRSARGITPREVELIVDAVRIIALELGVRFLSDYLRGDSYFKLGAADPPDLNKTRAVAQLTLFERLGEQADAARRCIAILRIRGWQSGNGGVMRELKIGTSWVRGVVGDALTPELIVNFSCAFGTWGNGGPVVIGRDTRRPTGRCTTIAGLTEATRFAILNANYIVARLQFMIHL